MRGAAGTSRLSVARAAFVPDNNTRSLFFLPSGAIDKKIDDRRQRTEDRGHQPPCAVCGGPVCSVLDALCSMGIVLLLSWLLALLI